MTITTFDTAFIKRLTEFAEKPDAPWFFSGSAIIALSRSGDEAASRRLLLELEKKDPTTAHLIQENLSKK